MSASATASISAQPDLFLSPDDAVSHGPEFSYDEILEKAREAIDADYAPSTDHAVGQMHADIAEAFGELDLPEPEIERACGADAGPVFEAEAEGLAPRITLHVFCELGETAELGERVLKDRRLARASGAIFTGGQPTTNTRYK